MSYTSFSLSLFGFGFPSRHSPESFNSSSASQTLLFTCSYNSKYSVQKPRLSSII
ncbi:hypothetical protein M758_3G249500 [Ceratodon purpureus]|nr:hypothetical protein M758_3G249500 [Ceratodon purpureus]